MDKASVFPKEKFSTLKEYLERAKRNGLIDVRIVELLVIENEVYLHSLVLWRYSHVNTLSIHPKLGDHLGFVH